MSDNRLPPLPPPPPPPPPSVEPPPGGVEGGDSADGAERTMPTLRPLGEPAAPGADDAPPPAAPPPVIGAPLPPTGAAPPPPIIGQQLPPPGAVPPPPLYYQLGGGNTSGQGPNAVVPPEIRGGWNWGGFGLSWIWAVAHKAWLGFALGMLCGLIGMVVCGAKGNEWAWQYRRFESIEHFREVQRKWAIWGIVVLVLQLLYVLASFVVNMLLVFSSSVPGPSGTVP